MSLKMTGSFKPLTGQATIKERRFPQPSNDAFDVGVNTLFAGDVSLNDTPSGDGGEVYTVITDVSDGTLVLNANGTFTYDPDTDFQGVDSFVYKVADIDGDIGVATVVFTVAPLTTTLDSGSIYGTSLTLSNGDLKMNMITGSSHASARTVDGVSSGKYYMEVTINSSANSEADKFVFGIMDGTVLVTPTSSGEVWKGPNRVMFHSDGTWFNRNGTLDFNTSHGLTRNAVGDTWGIAFNANNRAVWIHRNGVWGFGASTAEIAADNTSNAAGIVTASSGTYYLGTGNGLGGNAFGATWNFGASSYVHTPPSGYGVFG